ncbi:MAG: spore maturation protein [Firmicutes bacterium]|nr:spore maturation protein [Bacillota bacterium]
MFEIIKGISNWSIAILILIIPLYGFLKGVKVYDVFVEGAKGGVKTVLKIFPYLLAMMIVINIFRVSGAMNLLINLINPVTKQLGIPDDVLPLLFLRPLSGNASLSYTSYLLKNSGPDSFIGKLASTIQGSTETTFYIIAVYFGAIGIKKYRYAVTVGLLADIAGFFAAVFVCKLLFL